MEKGLCGRVLVPSAEWTDESEECWLHSRLERRRKSTNHSQGLLAMSSGRTVVVLAVRLWG